MLTMQKAIILRSFCHGALELERTAPEQKNVPGRRAGGGGAGGGSAGE